MGVPMDRSGALFRFDSTFEEAFPALEDAIIEFAEIDAGPGTRKGRWSFRKQGGLMPCGNPKCKRGGYQFDFDIDEMVRVGKQSMPIDKSCPGDESTPKGGRLGDFCMCSIQGTIRIIPKSVPG